jgi:hypothetical protein
MALNNSQLHQLVLDNLPNNVTQLISPTLLREVCDEIIDSYFNIISNQGSVGLNEYDPASSYPNERGVLYLGDLYQADVAGATTPGAFNPSEWNIVDSTSAVTANYILKTNGIELDDNKKVVLLATDSSLLTLGTGLYEAQASTNTVGPTNEYPTLGKGNLQVFKGSSNARTLHTWTPFDFVGGGSKTYVRNLNSDWVTIDLSTGSQNTFGSGLTKIGNEVILGGGYDSITLTPNVPGSEFKIAGSNVAGSVDINVSATTIQGDTTLSYNNNAVNIGVGSVSITSDSEVDVFNLKPSSVAIYKQDFFGTGSTIGINNRSIPDFGLVKTHVSDVLDAAILGAEYANGLTATEDPITSAITVGLGGELTQDTVVDLSGRTISFIESDGTGLGVNNLGVVAKKINEANNTSVRLDVNEFSAGLVYSNSGETSDFASIKMKVGGTVEVLGSFTQNGSTAIISNNLTQLNSSDVRLTQIPSATTALGNQVVIKNDVTGKLTTIDATVLSPDTSTSVEGSENIDILNTGTTNYRVVLNDNPDVNSVVVADAIYHKGDLDTRVEFEPNRINMIGGADVNIAQFGFGNRAIFNPDQGDVHTLFYSSGSSSSIAGAIAGNENYFFIGGDSFFNGVANGAHLRMAQSNADHAQINFFNNSSTNPTAPAEGDVWYNGTNFYFNDGTTNIDILASAGGGEVNTASNLIGEGLFFQKAGSDLEFKGLSAGTNVTLSSDNNTIVINSTGFTRENVTSFGVSATLSQGDEGYIVATSAGITLSLPTSPLAGTTYKIKDGTGTAQSSPILIDAGAVGIDGNSAFYVNENYGAVTAFFDGSTYFIL